MADRSDLTEKTQIGVETLVAPGTAVAATRLLQALSIGRAIELDMDEFRPSGSKFPTIIVPTKEWITASLEGRPTYDELVYPLSSVIGNGTVTQLLDGATPTGVYDWVFEPLTTAPDVQRTFTVEKGSSVRADRFPYGIVNELTVGFDRNDGASLGGSMIGQRIEDGITLSVGATALDVRPVTVDDVSVYIDTPPGAFGTTKMLRCISTEWSFGDRVNPVWPLDQAVQGFAGHIESEPSASMSLVMEADAQGLGPLAAARAGDTRRIRVEAIGNTLYSAGVYAGVAALKERLRIDLYGKVEDVSDYGETEGLVTLEWTFAAIKDALTQKAFTVSLRNQLAAL
jgi:hypothetical protein